MATHTTLPSLLHLTIEEAAEGLRSGLFTTVDLTKAYLKRIDEVTELNAILQLNPDALTVAHELDERARSGNGKSLGPLHGLPILVKDSIATADKLEASAGSFALLGAKPKTESSVIAKLRKAGVLVLGKTNMSEFANFRGLNISPGWSPRGGQTLGAYYPDCTPEGSSSGSAVAAALGLSTAAIGAETWGSITEPAEFNNVVGLKPSRGLVANDGVVPISSDQDVVGTLTRTVKDAAYMLNIMAGRSEQDKGTWSIPFEQIPDYTTFCGGTDLRGVTIGVPRNAFPSDPTSPIMISFEAALKTLATAGATVVDNADFSDAKGFMKYNQEIRGIVRSSANNRDMPAYLETLEHNPNNLRSSGDIKAWIEEHPELEDYPLRDTGKLAWMLKEGINVDSDKYKDMLEKEKYYGGPGGIVGAMEKYQLDLLAVPSSWGIANDLASKMGFPALSVPLGFFPEGTAIKREDMHPNLIRVAPGIPYSMVLISQSFREPDLLRVAHAFEELVGVRANGPAPYKVPRTELKDVVAGMMSFESLDSHSRAILGVLSFIQPDKIPEALFEPESSTALPASLKFCSDNFLFSPAIENLVTLELIKRDKASRTLSLHRPVQDNFKSSMNPEQRQQAFNDATMLVSTAFPHRDSTVAQLYQMWAGCAVYEPHVIALKDNFKKELVANPKFTVPQAYCIMSNMCQRYLLELRSFEVLADLLDVNTMALATLRESEQTINIQGSLTSHKGQLLTHIGKAEEGVKWLRKSYDIRSRDVPFHPRESAWAADNLAVGFATLNRFEEAAKWHIKARDHFQEWSNHQTERKGEWPAEIMNSMGLGLVWSGQPTPARELMDGALEKVNSVEPYNWAVAASTHFGLGTVERYEGNWDAAEAHFIEAQNLWLQRSRILSDPFNGACLYRLGCTALDKGQPEDAVRYLRDALEVTKKRKTEMVAEHMRGLFKLSEALEQEPRYAEEARATRDEAESLLRQLVPDASNAGKESTYDSLVCILWR